MGDLQSEVMQKCDVDFVLTARTLEEKYPGGTHVH